MDIQLRAIEIQRHWPMAEWRAVVNNESFEFRDALTTELKIICDRTRAARIARQTLSGATGSSTRAVRASPRPLTQSRQEYLCGAP